MLQLGLCSTSFTLAQYLVVSTPGVTAEYTGVEGKGGSVHVKDDC